MLKMPIEDIIVKIKEKTGMEDTDIEAKIQRKMDELSGLISREGAAHIIANELGIKLFDDISGQLKVGKILVGMRNVETAGKVQRFFGKREFQSGDRAGKVANMMIADETGGVRVVCWGKAADLCDGLKEGDIVKISGAYTRENQGNKEVHLNDNSKLELNPAGVTIGEVKAATAAAVESVRKNIKDLQENDNNVEILATIVQVFDPRFFEVCPQCNKRTKPDEGKFNCAEHGEVVPKFSYVTNVVVDDGSETMRTVCFKAQTENLFGMDENAITGLKDSMQGFDLVKNDLLGQIIKIQGRVTRNTFFDRLEFMANVVIKDVDPEKEMNKLD